MKKSITIHIPAPCHEDWAIMTATEKGKFCNVCTKEVFDLTSKTDEELVKILTKNKNACGRVKKSQLNREVKLERKSGQSLAPLAASLLLPLTLFSNNPKSSTDSTLKKPMISMGIGRFSTANNLRIQIFTKGIVYDENGKPLKDVEIISNESETRAWTNKNGEYEIYTLDREWLSFNKENYETQKIQLSNTSEIKNIILKSEIEIKSMLLGKIAVQPIKDNQPLESIIKTKGIVTDDTGLPLPGVNILIKGTSTGTQSDFDGIYEIETKAGDVLVFTYIGFIENEVTISNISNFINVNMSPDFEMLSGEMVVVLGGISYEDYQPNKDEAWKEKVKQASENGRKFEKRKWEKIKAARKKSKQ